MDPATGQPFGISLRPRGDRTGASFGNEPIDRVNGRRRARPLGRQRPGVERVARIERHAVDADRAVEAAILRELLPAVVTRSTQRLQFTEPKLLRVTFV